MLLGTLLTRRLQDKSLLTKPVGQFELEVNVEDQVWDKSKDKAGLLKHYIAQYLASAVIDSTVPTEYWGFAPTPEVRLNFNLPELIAFGLGEDQ